MKEQAPIEEVGEGASHCRRPLSPERGEESEDGLPLVERDVGNLSAVTSVPAEGGPVEALGLAVPDEEAELKSVSEADVLELRCSG